MREKGSKSVVWTEEDMGPLGDSILPRYTKLAINSWVGIVIITKIYWWCIHITKNCPCNKQIVFEL